MTTFPTAQISRNDLFRSCCFQCIECSDIFRSQVVDLEEQTFTRVVILFQIIHEANRGTVHVYDRMPVTQCSPVIIEIKDEAIIDVVEYITG